MGDLLYDFNWVDNAAGPEYIPDAVDLITAFACPKWRLARKKFTVTRKGLLDQLESRMDGTTFSITIGRPVSFVKADASSNALAQSTPEAHRTDNESSLPSRSPGATPGNDQGGGGRGALHVGQHVFELSAIRMNPLAK